MLTYFVITVIVGIIIVLLVRKLQDVTSNHKREIQKLEAKLNIANSIIKSTQRTLNELRPFQTERIIKYGDGTYSLESWQASISYDFNAWYNYEWRRICFPNGKFSVNKKIADDYIAERKDRLGADKKFEEIPPVEYWSQH